MAPEHTGPNSGSHPLAAIGGISSVVVATLKQRWVDTAEEALAMSSTPEGRAGLRALLSFDDLQLQTLLHVLRSEVGVAEANRLERATPGGARGVILGDDEKRRFKLG